MPLLTFRLLHGIIYQSKIHMGLQLSWQSACFACKRPGVRLPLAPSNAPRLIAGGHYLYFILCNDNEELKIIADGRFCIIHYSFISKLLKSIKSSPEKQTKSTESFIIFGKNKDAVLYYQRITANSLRSFKDVFLPKNLK